MAGRARSSSKRRPEPRSLLQKARFDRGWSQQQVVDRLQTICSGHRDREPCRLDVAKLSDYERNARHPSLAHIEALARVYKRSPEALGLITWRDHPDDELEQPEQEQEEPLVPLAFLVIPIGRDGPTAEAMEVLRGACRSGGWEFV